MRRSKHEPALHRFKEWVERVVIILSILDGVAYSVNTHTSFRIPEDWITAGMAAVVILALSWLFLAWILKYIRKIYQRGITERFAEPSELEEVFDLCRSFYDHEDHVINRDSLKAFMSVDKQTAKLFYRNKQLFGLYIVFSINRRAVRNYLDGTFDNAQELDARYAVSDRRHPAGLYVTNIAARGYWFMKAHVVTSLKKDLKGRIHRHRSIEYVFARMANRDGAKLLERFGFEKTKPHLENTQVWKYGVVFQPDDEEESDEL